MDTVIDSNFDSEVLGASNNQVVVVNFSASWCQPCKAMRPKVEALEKESSAKFVYCDVDDAPIQTDKFGVMGVPTYVVMRGGAEFNRFSGSGPEIIEGIKAAIANLEASS
jgi:thioredoxin-like negative regulator of GroEL